VCVGRAATLEESDPVVQLTRSAPPEFDRKLPYIYGTVRRPGPVYDRLPEAAELARAEPDLERRMRAWLSEPSEAGAGYAQHVWLGRPGVPPDPARTWDERTTDGVPELLASGNTIAAVADDTTGEDVVAYRMRSRAGYSFLRTFLWQGRRYGLTADLTIAPTDRFRPIQGSDFRGVELGKEMELPFAFVRRSDARYWTYQRSTGSIVDSGAADYRAAVPLTGKQNFFRGRLHYETKDGRWLSDRDASRIDPAKRMPAWGTNGERWLDVNLTKQTLVAYAGTRPVYATLVSTGEAGLEDHEHSTATKRGIFRIHTKHVSSTMSSDEAGEAFELRDVPYVQYFDQGYALHGAYWHDRFGTPKSHGCINLSPEDARRLFFFTEPALPQGWHGVLLPLRGTVIFVHP
jgi:lipoprotein-anchoring transpeptidase ErfK/SrfK